MYKKKQYLYFAYGPNLFVSQMHASCPYAEPMMKVNLYNARVVFRDTADIEYVKSNSKRLYLNKVQGALYKISRKDMTKIDKYMDCPKKYKKVKCTVFDRDLNPYEAFMYKQNPNVQLKLPSEAYLNKMYLGYLDWKLSLNALSSIWEYTANLLNINLNEANSDE